MNARIPMVCLALLVVGAVARATGAPAGSLEPRLAEAVKSQRVTIVHFWAPWCPNCKAELAQGGWSGFIAAHPDVDFIFVTTWNATDGHEVLAKYGVGAESNFTLLQDPNGSKKRGEKTSSLLGLPISWIPTTWVFRDGRLRYALNYGELRFPTLGQLIADASDQWKH
jgi:thiol-disulfide isomerase/thioredoxin